MSFIVGIDASRNRSGGAKAHIIGILTESNPLAFGIKEVHLWAYASLAGAIPNFPWLIKHTPVELEQSLIRQVWWQFRQLPIEAANVKCDIMLNTDAGSVGAFKPSVTMSRDMLSYEKGEMQRYGWTKARLRLIVLKYVQARSLKKSRAAIFLTKHASDVIQHFTGPISCTRVIPHGVSNSFRQKTAEGDWANKDGKEIRCLYVSNAALYKHQWHVVRAIAQLRMSGHNLKLVLAGGGSGKAQALLDEEILRSDPAGEFVKQLDYLKHEEIPRLHAGADLFIFASSCENMPNTLVEAMAAGLPIACSERGPMPEVLQDGGVYFDPENPISIRSAVEQIITDEGKRTIIARRAKALSGKYSWERCGNETWEFLTSLIVAK